MHLTQPQEDHKHNHLLSEVEPQDLARLIHQATNHLDQLLEPATQELLKLVVTTQLHHQLVELQVTNHQAHHNIQALKAHTQVLELQSHLPTCHRHLTSHHKVSHHKMLLIQQLEPLKRQPEIISPQDEVKLM